MNLFLLAVTNQEALGSIASIGGIVWLLCAIIGLIYVLCPILYLFSFARLEKQGKTHIEYQTVLLKEIRRTNALQENANNLSRQLLRAYGHEPEV